MLLRRQPSISSLSLDIEDDDDDEDEDDFDNKFGYLFLALNIISAFSKSICLLSLTNRSIY